MTDDELNRDYGGWLSAPSWLSAFELKVVRDAVAGDVAEPPHTADGAPDLRAMVVRRLFLGLDDGWLLTPLGLRVKGARIVGKLDLAGLSAAGGGYLPPLDLAACTFTDEICLGGTRIDDVRLDGADFPRVCAKGLVLARGFSANGAVCEGEILLENCRAGDGVSLEDLCDAADKGAADDRAAAGPSLSLTGAVLAGDLILNRARLARAGGVALDLNGACIRNIEMRGITVLGRTDALALKVPVSWFADNSRFESRNEWTLSLDSAELGKVVLDGATMIGAVRAIGATIDGQWSANQAYFENAGENALSLDSSVMGTVFLVGTVVRGAVSATYAKVHGVINAHGARFSNPGGGALNLFACEIDGGVYLQDHWEFSDTSWVQRAAEISGQLDLTQAKIGGNLSMDGVRLSAANEGPLGGLAVDGRELEVKGAILWSISPDHNRPNVSGAINFGGAVVHGDVDMADLMISRQIPARATPAKAPAPDSAVPVIDRSRALRARGTFSRFDLEHVAISLVGTQIGGNLTLRGIRGNSADIVAMAERDALASAAVSGDVDCVGRPWHEPALEAPPDLSEEVAGCIDLSRTVIGRDLFLDGGRLSASEPAETAALATDDTGRIAATALSLRGAAISKTLHVRDLSLDAHPGPAGVIDLRGASCGHLDDGPGGEGWGARPWSGGQTPCAYRLDLDGFVYGGLNDPGECGARWVNYLPYWRWWGAPPIERLPIWARRIQWLRRQFRGPRPTPDDYVPQPWRQLAACLRAAGRDDDARRVSIAQFNFRLETRVEPKLTAAWSWAVRVLFGYGYSPISVAGWLAVFLAIGGLCVGYWAAQDTQATRYGKMSCEQVGFFHSSTACPFLVTPEKDATPSPVPAAPPPRCDKPILPVFYAMDAFIPVNLKEQERCDLNPNRPIWRVLKALYALWGWIFTPLAALTFAGVLKRD